MQELTEHIESRKGSSEFLKRIVFLLVFLGLNAVYLICKLKPEAFYLVALLWVITVCVLLWLGNRLIYKSLNKRFPWVDQPSKRFFLQLSLNLVYSLSCINVTYYLFVKTIDFAPDREDFFVLNVYGLLFIIPVLSINFGIFFLMQWKNSYEQSDKLKQENLRTQLESLRSHIDPHFLFNNLNILSSLIQRDPKDAQLFLDKFADVYRYVLQYKKEELVPLVTELEFIHAYIFLLQKRFGDQVRVRINVPDNLSKNICIAPLSLQMLVENAIKHTKNSKKDPLEILIFIEEGTYLVVQNNYQPLPAESSGLVKSGLENIRKRYSFLSDLNVKVIQNEQHFIVKLPLLEMTE